MVRGYIIDEIYSQRSIWLENYMMRWLDSLKEKKLEKWKVFRKDISRFPNFYLFTEYKLTI